MTVRYELAWHVHEPGAEPSSTRRDSTTVCWTTTGVAQVERHSLGWVTARDGDLLVGFVNVAWDGAIHAFILDTLVAATHQRHGRRHASWLGMATDQARSAGCEWLHVDFDDELREALLRRVRLHPDQRGPHPSSSR